MKVYRLTTCFHCEKAIVITGLWESDEPMLTMHYRQHYLQEGTEVE